MVIPKEIVPDISEYQSIGRTVILKISLWDENSTYKVTTTGCTWLSQSTRDGINSVKASCMCVCGGGGGGEGTLMEEEGK